MIDPATIRDCLAFLNRVQLTGNEVPAFVNVTNQLHAELQRYSPQPPPVAETAMDTAPDASYPRDPTECAA